MNLIDTTNHNYPIRGHILQIICAFPRDDKFNNIDLLALAFLVATRKKDDNLKSTLLNLVDDLKAPEDISRQQRFAKQFNASATREERKAFIKRGSCKTSDSVDFWMILPRFTIRRKSTYS